MAGTVLYPSDIEDIVTATTESFGPPKWTDLTSDLQEHHFAKRMFKKNRMKVGGRSIRRNIMVKHSGAAHHTGLFAVENPDVSDVMKTISVPYRFTRTHWAYDEREDLFNDGEEEIYDVLKTRELDALISLVEKVEADWWVQPPTTDSDEKTPFSYAYWIVKYPAAAATPEDGGFLGTNPVAQDGNTFSNGAGGLSSTTYPRWANWAAKYTNIASTDAIALMRKASAYTNFRSPVEMPTYDMNGDMYGIYMPYAERELYLQFLEGRNDRLGPEGDPYGKIAKFQGRPVEWVPSLDADTSAPIIGICWSTMFMYYKEYMTRWGPKDAPSQPRVKWVFIDSSWNSLCVNRRRNWILSTKSSTGT